MTGDERDDFVAPDGWTVDAVSNVVTWPSAGDEPDGDEEFAAPPMIGYPTASDLTMVARATGGGIRSTELLPEPDDDEDDDPRYVAARAFCLARFEYPAGFYADPQAREQHIEMDTRSTAAEVPFRKAIDAAVHHTEQRLDRSEDHRVAELEAQLLEANAAGKHTCLFDWRPDLFALGVEQHLVRCRCHEVQHATWRPEDGPYRCSVTGAEAQMPGQPAATAEPRPFMPCEKPTPGGEWCARRIGHQGDCNPTVYLDGPRD